MADILEPPERASSLPRSSAARGAEALRWMGGLDALAVGLATGLEGVPPSDWVFAACAGFVPSATDLLVLERPTAALSARLRARAGGPPPIEGGARPAAHLVHATGLGWALRRRGGGRAVLVSFGEEAAPEPDLHAALNFAGVDGAPVVFVARVTSRRRRDPAGPDLLELARSLGLRAERADGTDPASLGPALEDALAEARAGRGPRLVSATGAQPGHADAVARALLGRAGIPEDQLSQASSSG